MMSSKDVIHTIVEKLLEQKEGTNNVKLAYTVGYLESLLQGICQDHPDVTWYLNRHLQTYLE